MSIGWRGWQAQESLKASAHPAEAQLAAEAAQEAMKTMAETKRCEGDRCGLSRGAGGRAQEAGEKDGCQVSGHRMRVIMCGLLRRALDAKKNNVQCNGELLMKGNKMICKVVCVGVCTAV